MKTLKLIARITKHLLINTTLIPYLFAIGISVFIGCILSFATGLMLYVTIATGLMFAYVFIFIISVQFFTEIYYTFKMKHYND